MLQTKHHDGKVASTQIRNRRLRSVFRARLGVVAFAANALVVLAFQHEVVFARLVLTSIKLLNVFRIATDRRVVLLRRRNRLFQRVDFLVDREGGVPRDVFFGSLKHGIPGHPVIAALDVVATAFDVDDCS